MIGLGRQELSKSEKVIYFALLLVFKVTLILFLGIIFQSAILPKIILQ